jgi:hypothetical protein
MDIKLSIYDYNVRVIDWKYWDDNTKAYEKFQRNIKEFFTDILNGKDVYIRNEEGARAGAIGKLKSFVWGESIGLIITNKTLILEQLEFMTSPDKGEGDFRLTIEFDNKKKMSLKHTTATWLKDYQGPLVFKEPKQIETKSLLDRFRSTIGLGSLVMCEGIDESLIPSKRYCTTTMIYFGHITKISKNNILHVQTFKTNDTEPVKEIRVKDNTSLIVVDRDFFEKLMLAKLAHH